MTRELPLPVELLQEWDAKLDTMETLLDACVELDEPCRDQLADVQRLRRSMRKLCPLDNQPIIVKVVGCSVEEYTPPKKGK